MTPHNLPNDDAALGELSSHDPAALDRLKRFGGGKLLADMIGLFMEAAPERIGAARAAVDAADTKAAEMALHSLKSSSAQLGALRMQRLCEQGENIARSGSLEGVDALVRELEAEYPSVHAWLDRARTAVTT